MKAIKFLLTSVVFLILSIFFLVVFAGDGDFTTQVIGFYTFLVAFIVFFILGWVVKDKPDSVTKTENNQEKKDK